MPIVALTASGLLGTTGFYVMGSEPMLIFAFQNMYGYIYQKAGLIVALVYAWPGRWSPLL